MQRMSRKRYISFGLIALLGTSLVWAESAQWVQARDLYQRTNYDASLKVLLPEVSKGDTAVLQLIGQNYFMLADYKKATEYLEKAAAMNPQSADAVLWLGRAYGRRAEVSSPFTAPGYASKARQLFEKAVKLDPTNRAALGDLFDYYMEAPGFLGGGTAKAEALAAQVAKSDPAEGHYYEALLAERRKQFDFAEKHLRAAMDEGPRQVARVIELAKFLGRLGRMSESEALFEEAARIEPENPRILFERASVYIKTQRNLGEARRLLERYLRSPLQPNDPPRQEAEALLKKTGA